jgi:hypothetical protein
MKQLVFVDAKQQSALNKQIVPGNSDIVLQYFVSTSWQVVVADLVKEPSEAFQAL